MPPRFFAALTLIVAIASTLPSAGFIAAFAQSTSSSSSCQATATIMNPAASENTADLPRWDLSRFGFASPFSDEIDSHLEQTAKLAEAFKVRTRVASS